MQAAFLLKAINVCSIGVLNGGKAQSSSQFCISGTQELMIIKPDNVGFEQTMQENMYTIKVVHVLYSMDKGGVVYSVLFPLLFSPQMDVFFLQHFTLPGDWYNQQT